MATISPSIVLPGLAKQMNHSLNARFGIGNTRRGRNEHSNGGTWSEENIKSEVLKNFITGTNHFIRAKLKQLGNRDLTEAIEDATIIEQNIMEADPGLLNKGKNNTSQDMRYEQSLFEDMIEIMPIPIRDRAMLMKAGKIITDQAIQTNNRETTETNDQEITAITEIMT
ncbi:hypothetical protein M0802_013643 [Mischocyttarus mexicanus]|nr:hypothetical protein M0802_013643 [Mischocyttarus mexicanus]